MSPFAMHMGAILAAYVGHGWEVPSYARRGFHMSIVVIEA